MPLISIITPVHPSIPDYLADAYESIAAQELPDGWQWQWLIQQDGQTEAFADLVPDDRRISYGSGRAGGAGVARTLALARADGEYVKVLDADDQLTPGTLSRDLAVLENNAGIGWTTSRVLDLMPDGSTNGFDQDPDEGPIQPAAVLQHWLTHRHRAQVHPATLCMRRSLLLMLGGWMALPASEDTGLLLALNAVSTGYFIAEPGLLYRKWDGQSTAAAAHTAPGEREARMRIIEARARALLGPGLALYAPHRQSGPARRVKDA
jgi:hypothetical protein